MGVIGFNLYDNDVAGDVQAEFSAMIYDGISCSEATQNMIEDSQELIQDEDDGPIFWIALADTQWEMGMLLQKIKKKAIAVIDKMTADETYEDEEYRNLFYAELNRIKDKLNSNLPPKIKISKKITAIYESVWDIGDVYCVQMTNENVIYDYLHYLSGRWLMLQVIDIIERKKGTSKYYYPIVFAHISKDTNKPDIKELGELEFIRVGGGSLDGYNCRFYISNLTKENSKKISYFGKTSLFYPKRESIPFNNNNYISFDIDDMVYDLADHFQKLNRLREKGRK